MTDTEVDQQIDAMPRIAQVQIAVYSAFLLIKSDDVVDDGMRQDILNAAFALLRNETVLDFMRHVTDDWTMMFNNANDAEQLMERLMLETSEATKRNQKLNERFALLVKNLIEDLNLRTN
jgi:hypothetical protein